MKYVLQSSFMELSLSWSLCLFCKTGQKPRWGFKASFPERETLVTERFFFFFSLVSLPADCPLNAIYLEAIEGPSRNRASCCRKIPRFSLFSAAPIHQTPVTSQKAVTVTWSRPPRDYHSLVGGRNRRRLRCPVLRKRNFKFRLNR